MPGPLAVPPEVTMKTPLIALRVAAVAAFGLTFAAACTSSHGTSSPGATTSRSPLDTPNSIPFEVGARVGLPGWLVQIVKVHKPYANSELPLLPADRQYV